MLPATSQPRPAVAPEARILVVDDEINIVELLAVSLKFQGFEVHTACSGTAALDLARQIRPDVVSLSPTEFTLLRYFVKPVARAIVGPPKCELLSRMGGRSTRYCAANPRANVRQIHA